MLKKLVERGFASRIFLGFVLGIIGGVVISTILRVNFFSSAVWLGFVGVALAFAFFRPSYLFAIVAVIAGTVLGSYRVSAELIGQDRLAGLVGKTVEISGQVKGDPDIDGESGSLRLEKLEINGENMRGVIYVSGRLGSDAERGDRLTIYGKMSEGFGAFSGAVYQPEVRSLEKQEPKDILISARDGLAESVREELGEREASLGIAYLLGMKNGLDEETLGILSLVGLTHLVVASGTHLGILVEGFRKTFGKISKLSGVFFSLLFIILFGMMIGWTASITRAVIVTGLTLVGEYAGRRFEAWRVIVIAMAVTLMINPMNLVDLGWMLSFASFIGIMVVAPSLRRVFYDRRKAPGKIAEILIATVSATVMCAPILLYYFGSLSLISVVANILILPTVPIAMGLTFLTGVVGFLPAFLLFDWMKIIVGGATNLILEYHLIVMEFFSRQTMFIIEIPKGKTEVLLLYIPIVVAIFVGSCVRARKKREMTKLVREHPEKYLRFSTD